MGEKHKIYFEAGQSRDQELTLRSKIHYEKCSVNDAMHGCKGECSACKALRLEATWRWTSTPHFAARVRRRRGYVLLYRPPTAT